MRRQVARDRRPSCRGRSVAFLIPRAACATEAGSDIVSLDMLENDTRSQHYVTQGEQRLNARNPQADPRNMRIYSFTVVDRENYTLALESPNGTLIRKSLSLDDIFSFDVPGGRQLRLNFESLFHKYEGHIKTHTKNLLAKLNGRGRDIKAEIIDLFAAKLISFVRNPFSYRQGPQ
jgi:hypothetical protein